MKEQNKLGLSWAKLSTTEFELGLVLIDFQMSLNLNKFVCVKLNLTTKLCLKLRIMFKITRLI